MNRTIIIILLFGGLIFGCAPFRGEGQVDTYITKRIERFAKYSKRPIKKATSVDLAGLPWEYSEDSHGFIVTVFGDHFDAVNNYFYQVLGPPSLVTTNYLGKPKAMYFTPDFGFSIAYSVRRDGKPDHSENVSIVVLNPKGIQ